jgi:hypothetical protein
MTIEQAIDILNRYMHNMAYDWRKILVPGGSFSAFSPSTMLYQRGLTEFEAVAVAEKYEREKPAEPEPPRSKAEEVANKIWLATVGRRHGITE